MKGKLRIYCTGGAGINIGSIYADVVDELGVALTHAVYVDTSRSNLTRAGIDKDELTFLLKDVDGSGKVRRDNHEAIAKNIKQLVQQHPPMDFNVVVFSASGGSGSVFGPLILQELLNRKLPAIAVVIGSNESAITAQNTVNTLKSLESVAKRAEVPVVMHYSENTSDIKRSDVDHRARVMIGAIAYLTSGENSEMDTRDVLNWVQFHHTTKVGPCLATVEFYSHAEDANKTVNPISIASLYASPDNQDLTAVPEYHTTGYPLNDIEILHSTPGIHYVISNEEVPDIYKHAQAVLNEIDERRNARVKQESLIDASDDVSDTGLVL